MCWEKEYNNKVSLYKTPESFMLYHKKDVMCGETLQLTVLLHPLFESAFVRSETPDTSETSPKASAFINIYLSTDW